MAAEDLLAGLARGVATTCLCWRLTRRDGIAIGVTDHDRTVSVDGLDYHPGASLEAAVFSLNSGLAPGTAAARGALDSDGLTEADLAAGLWDGAQVEVHRVDWQSPEARIWVWSGYLASVSRGEMGFQAELVSRKADLERPLGRLFSRRCDAVLGDARCRADPGARTCDQRFETCRDVFDNVTNFRGFPHMPGRDAMLAGPAAAGNDGGRR